METEAGGPGSALRKRKRAPIQSAEERAADHQAPPPGAREDKKGAADRISNVPDAILGDIVSLLPTKEGARTQILTTRWRHIWRSAPLNLDCSEVAPLDLDSGGVPKKHRQLDHVVKRILAPHHCPVRRLCIPPCHGCTKGKVESLLQSPALDNLRELELCVPHDRLTRDRWSTWGQKPFMPPLQPSVFRFAATLCLLNIGKCDLVDNTVRAVHFPKLKHLALHWVYTTESSLQTLIARCPALECLLICYISGFRFLRINSIRLRRISLRAHLYYLEELVIENAPCLERLIRNDLLDGVRVSVIFAPKLEFFGSVNSGDRSFSRFIERFHYGSRTTVARLVKSLVVHMPVLSLDKVIDLIRCFPSLEKLYIQNESVHVSWPKKFWRRKHRKLIECLDIRLKTIVLQPYRGGLSEVNFVEFFVLNAGELDLMTIQVETIDDEFIARQHRLLQLEKKASRGALTWE